MLFSCFNDLFQVPAVPSYFNKTLGAIGKMEYIQYEVDFIANNGTDKYYIQSAFGLDSEEKKQQELKSLLKIDDSFRKIVIVGNDIAEYTDNKGIRYIGLFQFLKQHI